MATTTTTTRQQRQILQRNNLKKKWKDFWLQQVACGNKVFFFDLFIWVRTKKERERMKYCHFFLFNGSVWWWWWLSSMSWPCVFVCDLFITHLFFFAWTTINIIWLQQKKNSHSSFAIKQQNEKKNFFNVIFSSSSSILNDHILIHSHLMIIWQKTKQKSFFLIY